MRIRREKRKRHTGWERRREGERYGVGEKNRGREYFPTLYTNIRISERHCKDMEIRQHRAVGRE